MNIHHLELFYYVARHGGITEAVRNIPYGIQQPAISGQVAQLEEYLGATLFQRRPFALTPAGEKLYRFVQPFFSNLDSVASELQGGKIRQIRIGASTIVLRDHLPELFQNVRKRFPNWNCLWPCWSRKATAFILRPSFGSATRSANRLSACPARKPSAKASSKV